MLMYLPGTPEVDVIKEETWLIRLSKKHEAINSDITIRTGENA